MADLNRQEAQARGQLSACQQRARALQAEISNAEALRRTTILGLRKLDELVRRSRMNAATHVTTACMTLHAAVQHAPDMGPHLLSCSACMLPKAHSGAGTDRSQANMVRAQTQRLSQSLPCGCRSLLSRR